MQQIAARPTSGRPNVEGFTYDLGGHVLFTSPQARRGVRLTPAEERLDEPLETMFFPDEVRDRSEVEGLTGEVELSRRERDVAAQIIDSLSSDWQPERYHDTYREQVLDLIQRKAEGEQVVTERPRPTEAPVVDLMAALEASLQAARGGVAAVAPRSRASSGGDGREDFESWNRRELYEEAKRQNISGRSEMTKDELIDALGKAS